MTAERAPDESFFSLGSDRDLFARHLDPETLRPAPSAVRLDAGPGRWDHIQHGDELDFHQSDCNWFAWEARSAGDDGRYAGILALHRTGPRLTGLGRGTASAAAAAAPRSLRPLLMTGLADLIPVAPRFDANPLFLSVLYDLDGGARPAECDEASVEGTLDPDRFSFVSTDGRQQVLHAASGAFRRSVPRAIEPFFAYDGPAFAVRTCTDRFELEVFLRPDKNPVAYGPAGSPALKSGRTTIHYVQRPRLQLIGALRTRGADGAWEGPRVLRGDGTQDRHWMTLSDPGLRWLWFMGRFDDGRDCMIYAMRTADGGRNAPADAGRPAGGGAWIVEPDGEVRPIERWSLTPQGHRATSRGSLPTRFVVRLPDEGIELTLAHERATFVRTRALGELIEAGIWESPARLERATGVRGGRFWVDYMPPFGGV